MAPTLKTQLSELQKRFDALTSKCVSRIVGSSSTNSSLPYLIVEKNKADAEVAELAPLAASSALLQADLDSVQGALAS